MEVVFNTELPVDPDQPVRAKNKKKKKATNVSVAPAIIVQPPNCLSCGGEFGPNRQPIVLECGCTCCVEEVSARTTLHGSIYCSICNYNYTFKKGQIPFKDNKVTSNHLKAQKKRMKYFEKEIKSFRTNFDCLVLDSSDPELDGEADIPLSDSSDVSDSSESDPGDVFSFDASEYALLSRMVRKLRSRHDDLVERTTAEEFRIKTDINTSNAAGNSPPPSWKGEGDGFDCVALMKGGLTAGQQAKIKAKQERRAAREVQRKARAVVRASSRGPNKAVHNVIVLGKNVPKAWRDNNPNAKKPDDYEEKMREKKGWLTEKEQDEMDEDEAEVLKAKRRQEWKNSRPKCPKIWGSIQRQRWVMRLYNFPMRELILNRRVAKCKTDKKDSVASKWERRLARLAAHKDATKKKIAARVEALTARGRPELAKSLRETMDTAGKLGQKDVTDKLAAEEAQRQAEELAREKARKAAEDKARKAAERAQRLAAGLADEGDEGDEGDEP